MQESCIETEIPNELTDEIQIDQIEFQPRLEKNCQKIINKSDQILFDISKLFLPNQSEDQFVGVSHLCSVIDFYQNQKFSNIYGKPSKHIKNKSKSVKSKYTPVKKTVNYDDDYEEESDFENDFDQSDENEDETDAYNSSSYKFKKKKCKNLISEKLAKSNNIFTPNWEKIDDKTINDCYETESSNENVKFNVCMHKKLEIYENRIINGESKYQHPACSIFIEKEDSDFKPNDFENQKLARYDLINPKSQIPLFWEERVWDNKDELMTDEENENLLKKISESNQDSPTRHHSLKKIAKSKSEKTILPFYKKKKQIKNSTYVELSNMYYETDDSCDETDIDLF